jgi:hypothetical protein
MKIIYNVLTPKQSKIDNCIFLHFLFFFFMPIGVPKVPFLVPGDDEASYTIDFSKKDLGQEVNGGSSRNFYILL